MSDLSSRVNALDDDQRRRLEAALLARRRGSSHSTRRAITRRDMSVPAVLSSAQRRLWFLDRLAPGSTTYNAVVSMWLRGPVDYDALEEAVADVVRRHEVLRSVIRVVDDEPVQVVLEEWQMLLERHVADGATSQERRWRALDIASEVAGRPYDLAHDLTVRAAVVQTAPEEALFVLAEHHISFDGWSDEVVFREISSHYAAVLAGETPARQPPPVQYADYAVWERARIEAGALGAKSDYWRRQLAGAPAVTNLPLDRPRPDLQRFDGRHLRLSLDHAAGVRAFRVAVGATDFMVLVAAWAATLYRWSGEVDLVLGTPMANRNNAEVEELVGFFSNTVPLRVRVDGSAGFAELVTHVREVALEAFEHQELPFEHIVDTVNPRRVPGANPLFQVNVRVQSGPPPRLELPGVDVELVHVDLGFSRFDLAVELQMEVDRIGGYLEYNQAVIDPATAEEVVARLDQLLGAALADPAAPLWSLPQPSSPPRRRTRRSSVSPSLAPRRSIVTADLSRRLDVARPPCEWVSEPDLVNQPERRSGADVWLHWFDLTAAVDPAPLSQEERERAMKFRSDRDRLLFVRRRARLRQVLAEFTGTAPVAIRLEQGEFGRPFVVGHPAVKFSAASSGRYAVVAVSAHEVGVDVERRLPHRADRDVARRLFAPEEAACLEEAEPALFERYFFNCWTRKEAYVKATGLGLSFPLATFAVEVHDTESPRLLRSALRPQDLRHRSVRAVAAPDELWVAAVVTEHRDPVLWSNHSAASTMSATAGEAATHRGKDRS